MGKEKVKKKVSGWVMAGAILVLVVLTLTFLFRNGSESYVQKEVEQRETKAISCLAGGIEGAFFSSETANTIENTVKITFSDNRVDKLFYTYNGVYRSDEMAESDSAALHAKYNIYMSDNGIAQESLLPYFSRVGNKLQITLYAGKPELVDSITAKMFFIDVDEINAFRGYSMDQVQNYYEKQGFSCKNT